MMQDFSFVHKYFMAEKQAGIFLLLVGLVALLAAISFLVFVKSNPSFYKGMALALILVGLLQLTVGYIVFQRSDQQRLDTAYKIGMDPGFVKNTELPRMKKVQQRLTLSLYGQLALLLTGTVLFFLYRNDPLKGFWCGLGLALALSVCFSLGADGLAAKRAGVYTAALEKLQ